MTDRSVFPLFVLFAIALVPFAFACHPSAHGTETRAKAKAVAATPVEVGEAELPNTLLLTGTLKANQESDVAANATGRVLRTMVERGSYVKSGQPVAQLDMRTARLSESEALANMETARTQKAAAQDECARYQRLFEQGAITQQELTRQSTSCKTTASSAVAAETRAQLAAQTLADATVRAPFPGLVAERFVSVGEYVMPSTKVAHIVDIDPLRLEMTIPEQHMGAIHEGQVVEFQVAAFPDRTFRGAVSYIGPSVRAATRDLVFEATVANKDKTLRPGLFATATVHAGKQQLPIVPKTAVRTDGETARIFAIVDGRAEERVVQIGPEQGETVAILQGVKKGERVVAKPTDDVTDGVEVQ